MNTQTIATAIAVPLFALLPLAAPGATQFWDPDGATPGTSVSGNWDTTTTNWTATVDSGVNTVWTQNNNATLSSASDYTVTLTTPITLVNFTNTGSAGTL